MSRRALAAWPLVLALAACPGPAPDVPIGLTYVQSGQPFDGDRAVVDRAAGAYVGVVVLAPVERRGRRGLGIVSGASGTIVDTRGYVVTAAHVARTPGHPVDVTTLDGRHHRGTVVDLDPTRDLALLKIEPAGGLCAATLAGPAPPDPGAKVFSIGTPGNRPGVVSHGRIPDRRPETHIEYGGFGAEAMEIAMDVEPGQSGAPLFDGAGRLIGIIAGFGLGDTRRVPYVPTGIGYAVPVASVSAYLAETLPGEPSTGCDSL